MIAGFVDSDGVTSEIRYCVTDHQGSVEKIVDDEGRVLWASCYTAFGIKGGETVNRIEFTGMFTGKDINPETGLTYHWNRWRSEDGSVWLSEDPARDGTNWYGYCGNNPVMFVDLNGLDYNGMPSNVQAQLGLPPNPTPKRDPSPKVEEPAENTPTNNNLLGYKENNVSGTIMYPTDGKNPYAFPKTFKEWSESVKDAWINLATHSDFIPEGHTQVLVIRPNEGYGNSFNSLRVAIKNDSGTIKVFTEMVGANAKESMAKKYEGMTRPDGDYYYTTKPLYPQNDGTYNSNSFINVLREVTNDPRIPENVRNSINNGDYLSHSSQKGKIVYTTPLSAGCTVSNGQKAQNQYIKFISPHVNTDGIVDNISIKYISGVY